MALRAEVRFWNGSAKHGVISNQVADEGQIEEMMIENTEFFGRTIITGEGSVSGHFNITLEDDDDNVTITVTYGHPGDDDQAHIELDNYIMPFDDVEVSTSKTIVEPGHVLLEIKADLVINPLQQGSSDEDEDGEPVAIGAADHAA